jgi:hypothetical protein
MVQKASDRGGSKREDITVQVRYKDTQETFSGSIEAVWLSLNKFFKEFLPSFEVASKLTLEVDIQDLAKSCEGIIAFADESSYLLVPRSKLTDNETLNLLLLAKYVGYRLGRFEKHDMSKEELQSKLGKDAKTTSTRVGELVKNGMVEKTPQEKYRITTYGVTQMQTEILPKIKAKTTA